MKLATLCYVRKDGKTLMLHRNKQEDDMHEGKYVGLGGKLKSGESPEECVIREVKEESGLQIKNPQLKGILTFANKGRTFKGKEQPDWYVFVYTATQFTGNIKPNNEGFLEWIVDEEVTQLPMWEGDKLFTPWIYEKTIFSGKLTYINDNLKDHTVHFYSN